jgi:molecular chaperone HscA
LQADGQQLLNDDERGTLAQQMDAVRQQLREDDVDALRIATETLGRASETFATRRMDRSIRQALAGVSLDELDEEDK